MAPGSLLDLDTHAPGERHDGEGHDDTGPRLLLTRGQIAGVRVLLVVYVLTVAVLTAANIPAVAHLVFGLIGRYAAARIALGILVSATVLAFSVLMGLSLYHFLRAHAGPQPARWWLWVILSSFVVLVGIVFYYLVIIEPEQRRLRGAPVAPASRR